MRTIVDFDKGANVSVRLSEDKYEPWNVVLYSSRILEDGRHEHTASIYFDMRSEEQLAALRKVVDRFEMYREVQAAVAVETTDHVECTETVAGEERWDRDAT